MTTSGNKTSPAQVHAGFGSIAYWPVYITIAEKENTMYVLPMVQWELCPNITPAVGMARKINWAIKDQL